MRAFAIAAIAVAGLLLSVTPLDERLDGALLDIEWSLLRKFAPKPASDDTIVVGIDDATVREIDAPPGLWHEPIGRALERIASARPQAIALDLALPERSYESFRAGLDAALARGLVAARANGPIVASVSIDARTRAARPIAPRLLAALGDQGLGIGLLGRDEDGLTRRFSLAVPTEDGAFPTIAGRLCRVLARRCSDGLIDYALGEPFRYVPLREVLASRDADYIGKLFRGRVVFIGDVRPGERVAVPVNLAGWESGGRLSPSSVVHAQSLRTATAGAPSEAPKPLQFLLVAGFALLVLVREWRLALAAWGLASVLLGVVATAALRSGFHFGVAAPMLTGLGAVLASVWISRSAMAPR